MQQWRRKMEMQFVMSLNKNLLLETASLSYSVYMGGRKTPKLQLSFIKFFPSSPKPTTSGTWQLRTRLFKHTMTLKRWQTYIS
jgi:hypothetical protein